MENGNTGIWKNGKIEKRKFANMEIFKVEIWKYGNMKIWKI